MDPIRAWIRTDPFRSWIGQAGRAWTKHRGWKKLGLGMLIVVLICVFLVTATVVLKISESQILKSVDTV